MSVLSYLSALFILVATTSSMASERLVVLPPDERPLWAAVGTFSTKGVAGVAGCSGILVAPDLVITAAHCTKKNTGLLDSRMFIAGLDGSRRLATSGAAKIVRHPVYDFTRGNNAFRFDLAVVQLGRPIDADIVEPVALFPQGSALPNNGALLAYRRNAKTSLHGRFDCTLKQTLALGMITSDCIVTSGNSGGAVMVKDGSDWKLAGIIVARNEPEGTAIALELNDWLRDLVRDAKKREAQRAALAE